MVPDDDFQYGAGNVSIQLGLKGKCTNVVTACATGTNCIGDALRAIQYGDADVMFAGGTESCICPTGIAGFYRTYRTYYQRRSTACINSI